MSEITCNVTKTGIEAPTLEAITAWFVAKFKEIYGSDVYIDPDSQDGQWLGIVSVAVHDANAMAVEVYNAFSPRTAQGEGLSRNVKINGIRRHEATYSTADLIIGGDVGTVIYGGIATDTSSNRWKLPEEVIIGMSGETIVTATASEKGAIAAGPATIDTIATPTRGWQTVTNPLAAVVGDPIETDTQLRQRQEVSTQIPSQTIFEGVIGAVAGLPGVTKYSKGVENDTSGTDENGVPPHSISLVVEGGDAQSIAQVIFKKKGPGTGTYGAVTEIVLDAFGVPHYVKFMRPTNVPVRVGITLKALSGYTSNIGAKIKDAVATYINGLNIGDEVYWSRVYVPANLSGIESFTFDITDLKLARDADALAVANLTMAYHEAASCISDDVTIAVI